MLDRAATKGYIHPNKAARLKSRLVKRLRAAANKPAARREVSCAAISDWPPSLRFV